MDRLLLPYKLYGRGMKGIYFYIFASCEPLNNVIRLVQLIYITLWIVLELYLPEYSISPQNK